MNAAAATSDGRILVVAVPGSPAPLLPAAPGDVVLRPAPGPAVPRGTGHKVFCGCCTPRGAIAEALARLHLEMVRGNAAPPRRVLVAAEPETLAAAFAADALLRARFRLDPAPSDPEPCAARLCDPRRM